MSRTMSAFRVHAWGETPRYDTVTVPVPAPGEALVRLEAAAVTHLDLTVATGDFVLRPDLPYVGGVEGAGTVVLSDTHAVGSRVSLRGGGLGTGRDGTWAEFVAVPEDAMRPVPEGLSAELAATSYDPLTTSYVALHEIARLGSWPMRHLAGPQDEVVVVVGAAGAVGSVAVQLALRAGARVIGLVSRRERAANVPPGAEVVTSQDLDRLAELTDQRPATLLVDTWGGQGLTERAHWVRQGGRSAVVGYATGAGVTLDLPNWMFDDVALLPVNLIERQDSADLALPELQGLLVRGDVTLAVTTFPLEAGSDVFALLGRGQVNGRAALRMPRRVEGP